MYPYVCAGDMRTHNLPRLHNSEYSLHGFTVRPSFIVNVQHSTSAEMSHVTSCDSLLMGHRALYLSWCLSTVLTICVGTSSSGSSARKEVNCTHSCFIASMAVKGSYSIMANMEQREQHTTTSCTHLPPHPVHLPPHPPNYHPTHHLTPCTHHPTHPTITPPTTLPTTSPRAPTAPPT